MVLAEHPRNCPSSSISRFAAIRSANNVFYCGMQSLPSPYRSGARPKSSRSWLLPCARPTAACAFPGHRVPLMPLFARTDVSRRFLARLRSSRCQSRAWDSELAPDTAELVSKLYAQSFSSERGIFRSGVAKGSRNPRLGLAAGRPAPLA